MDDAVLRAMAKWPNVPAVFGWLSLDRRGRWRLRGETIGNTAANHFISRNYACDAQGRWYFQNGPQRVFVALEYTPWIFHFDGLGRLQTHTGKPIETLKGTWFDEMGNMLWLSEHGVGIIDDRDLSEAVDCIRAADGSPVDDDQLALALDDRSCEHRLRVAYEHFLVPLGVMVSTDCASRFAYVQMPAE